jgi:hypothetical protein
MKDIYEDGIKFNKRWRFGEVDTRHGCLKYAGLGSTPIQKI